MIDLDHSDIRRRGGGFYKRQHTLIHTMSKTEYVRKNITIDEECEAILQRHPINLSALVRRAIHEMASLLEEKEEKDEEGSQ